MLLARFYTTGLILPREPPFDNDSSVIGLLTDVWLIVKGGGRTSQGSFHPSRDIEIKSTVDDIAVDL